MGTGEAPAGSIGCMTWGMACSSYPSHFGRAGCWEEPVRASIEQEDELLLLFIKVEVSGFQRPMSTSLGVQPSTSPTSSATQHTCATSPASVASHSTPYWATPLEG